MVQFLQLRYAYLANIIEMLYTPIRQTLQLMQSFKFAFTFSNSSKAIRMVSSQPCTEQASKSAILSIADYIINCFPFLVPPLAYDGEWPTPKVSLQSPWEGQIYHPFYEMWNDVIIQRVMNNYALRCQDTLFVDIQLNQDSYSTIQIPQNFEVIHLNQQVTSSTSKAQEIFNLPKIETGFRKIALLCTQQHSRVGYPFSMRICKDGLLLGVLYNNQKWDIIYFDKGEVPTPEQFAEYNAVILPGSSDSVLNWTPLRQQYLISLDKAMDLQPNLRVLGICYGLQALCLFYGSKVVRKVRKGGIERVKLNHSLRQRYAYLRELPQAEDLLISQHHEDFVTNIPEGFQLLGSSESSQVEAVIGRKGRIMAFQGHTEYYPKFTKLYQRRYTYYFNDPSLLTNFYIASNPENQKKCMMHSHQVYNCFAAFIRHQKL